ncbi:MAG TPA: hypothetical protein PKN36_10675, partial [bacterium]|nr:hypothetical protein [bacterium]
MNTIRPPKISREEKKRQLLEFVKKRREGMLKKAAKKRNPVMIGRRIDIPYVKKERKPKESDKSYMGEGKTRKERREKLSELFSKGSDNDGKLKLLHASADSKESKDRLRKREEDIAWKKAKAEQAAIEKKKKILAERAILKEARQARRDQALRLKAEQKR